MRHHTHRPAGSTGPELPWRLLTLLALLTPGLPAQTDRLHTSRPAGKELIRLPKEDDAFGFVIFGDRTTGRPEGLGVLRQAVADTNLLDPDLVMTVGDLVQGYNTTEQWLQQAAEFKAVMAGLRMPWFPVAGNHDVYWRGANRPEGEHEGNFEQHFGPLWYAFVHKQCWFVVLYSDEGDPATGRKDFTDPACQRISPAQFGWLQTTLRQARDARHVFVFLHHPRWLSERYGDDWQKVHAALAAAGNVRAVFAGHIHRMRYDGARDGIEYFTLAATGGNLDLDLPAAGYLHEFHAVTVRPEGIQVATLPVGTVIDPKLITGEVSDDARLLDTRMRPVNLRGLALRRDGSADGVLQFDLHNPARRPVEVTLEPTGDGWAFRPDHTHLVIPAGGTATAAFQAVAGAGDAARIALPTLSLRTEYLGAGVRFTLPARSLPLDVPPPADLGELPAAAPGTLRLDGAGDCLELPAAALGLPDGPFTAEAWLQGDDFAGRRALLAKTENAEWALFVSDGIADFSVHLDGRYVQARTAQPVLQAGRWHHLAGVFDGQEVRLYVDGVLQARQPAAGKRTVNQLPLLVGADPDGAGRPMSFFHGRIDDLRISATARYAGEEFPPPAHLGADADTLLLLQLDADWGPWTADASGRGAHPRRRGNAVCLPGGR